MLSKVESCALSVFLFRAIGSRPGIGGGVSASMMTSEYDGTLVLERVSAIGKLHEFADAVDADDFQEVAALLQLAGLTSEEVASVLKQMMDQ